MSEHAHAEHAHPDYKKIYFWLLGLLVVSLIGPEFGIQWVTLVTAFGIAFVKAYLVCKNFMHLDVEPRYVVYLMVTCLIFLLLFFAATAVDVMNAEGDNWTKPSFDQAVIDAGYGREPGADHGDAHGGGHH